MLVHARLLSTVCFLQVFNMNSSMFAECGPETMVCLVFVSRLQKINLLHHA